MVKKKKQKIWVENYRYFFLLLGFLVVIFFVYKHYVSQRSDSLLNKSLNTLGSNLESRGYKGGVAHECGLDESRKFDSRKVCGYELDYEKVVSSEEVETAVNQLIEYFDKESLFQIKDSLAGNYDESPLGKHTYSAIADSLSGRGCSLNINVEEASYNPSQEAVSVNIFCST